MSASRPNSLLVLLVVVPLALLAWLGVSLHRDSEERFRDATNRIIKERLQIAQSHLLEGFRLLVTELDAQSADSLSAASVAPWVEKVRISGGTETAPASDSTDELSALLSEWQKNRAPLAQGTGKAMEVQHFQSILSKAGWAELVSPSETMRSDARSGLAAQRLESQNRQMIYWRWKEDGETLLVAQLQVESLMASLSSPVRPLWLTSGQGTLLVLTETNKVLSFLGDSHFDLMKADQFSLNCSPPLAGLKVSYIPGPDEFPSATLFPILLGATSGSLLVPSLAWLFFRENRRELQLAQQRVSFVNQVSHELKTPLTNIRLYAEMVRARAEDADDKISVRQLTVVETETARLSRLIQNVLNFARKQRERLTIQTRRISLVGLIEAIAVQWRPILEKRGIALHLDQPEQVDLEADPDALEQIIGNLLSNIEKYAAEGCYVRLAVVDDTKRVVVSVEDKGPGIPPGKQEFIFEPFERLRSDLREGVSGTGIGLTISRELARLHGGDLTVDPSYTQGARFVLTLPLPPLSTAEEAPSLTA